jgi:hypothetical protein
MNISLTSGIWSLILNLKVLRTNKSQMLKDVNRNICKMVKPSNFHGKNNTTFEDVMSFLKTLEVGED